MTVIKELYISPPRKVEGGVEVSLPVGRGGGVVADDVFTILVADPVARSLGRVIADAGEGRVDDQSGFLLLDSGG